MALVEYAKSELDRLYRDEEITDYDQAGRDAVIQLVETFANQGHSGFSANWVLAMAEKLMRFEPLTPLTGEDDEWTDIAEMNGAPMWQNNRSPRVFKEGDGQAYDIDGKVFVEPDGTSYTSRDSRVYVTFPYTPTTEYVQVEAAA